MTYAPFDANRVGRPASHFPVLPALSRIIGMVDRYREARRGRREIARLAQLDDRLLADIGVTRADVTTALMTPWNVDPSLDLAGRAGRRWGASRWAVSFHAS